VKRSIGRRFWISDAVLERLTPFGEFLMPFRNI
jgi:hypothetical protein